MILKSRCILNSSSKLKDITICIICKSITPKKSDSQCVQQQFNREILKVLEQ